MSVVALDAGALHDAPLGVADNALAADLGELMDGFLPLALAQTQQRHALELISRAPIVSPGKREVAELAYLDACLARLAQLLANVVQERCRDAERHGAWG